MPRISRAGFAAPALDRPADEVLLALADRLDADGLLELEDEPGADRLDDRRRAALLAVLDVVEVDVLGRVDVGDGAAAGDRRDAVAEEVAAGDEDARRAGPADELVGRDEDRRPWCRGPRRPGRRRDGEPSGAGRRGAISISTYGAAAAKSQNESAPWRWSRTEIARVSERMPVTLDAAEKLPICSGRSAWRDQLGLEAGEVDPPVGVLRDRDHVGDRLAPRQLVAVVLVGADEDDRALGGRDPRREVVALVELGREAQRQDVDEPVDGGGRARADEDDDVLVGRPDGRPSTIWRASSRKRVVWSPVPDDSVWVLA